jgi:uncharacterized membrane protein
MNSSRNERTATERETGRIEAFSDGVFAIAMTLLILDIKVPPIESLPEGGGLLTALLNLWPAYLAYVTSFATILIMWVNHHKLFKYITRTDHYFLLLNGLLLMWITIVPFPTALLSEYIQHPDATVAAAVFGGTYLLIAIAFNLLWRYASHNNRLLDKRSDPRFVQSITNQYAFGPIFYAISFALVFVSVPLSLAMNLALALFFAIPDSASRSAREN